jgi:hypothetical protein
MKPMHIPMRILLKHGLKAGILAPEPEMVEVV